MKMMVVNTPRGLIPCGDDDYSEKRKLKIGQTYSVEIRLARNADFHRKYFALIAYAWEFLTEAEVAAFKSKDGFRKSLQLVAGYYNPIYNVRGEEIAHEPMSISFGSMDNAEFSDLYERVKDVIFSIIGSRVTREEFERILIDF